MLKDLVLERKWTWLCVFLSVLLLAAGSLRAADDSDLLSKQELKNLIATAKTPAGEPDWRIEHTYSARPAPAQSASTPV